MWNARGLENQDAIRAVNDSIVHCRLDILILTKTRLNMDRVQRVVERLHFDEWKATDNIGRRGGGVWWG